MAHNEALYSLSEDVITNLMELELRGLGENTLIKKSYQMI